MDKEIKEVRKENNFVKYTTKEMLAAVHTKIDRIEGKLEEGAKSFVKVGKDISHHKVLIYALYACVGTLFLIILDLKGVI